MDSAADVAEIVVDRVADVGTLVVGVIVIG